MSSDGRPSPFPQLLEARRFRRFGIRASFPAMPARGLDILAGFSDAAGMTYPGGKNGAGVYQTIINLMPPHQTYIEPFLGGGAIMRLKRPAALNIGLDLQAAVLARTRDAVLHAAFGDADVPTAANGDGRGYRFLRRCAIGYLEKRRWGLEELVYCDPPYLMSTRRSGPLYQHEFSDRQHRHLLRVLRKIPAMVMISGYWSEMYAKTLKDWNHTTFQTTNRAGQRTTEHLWYNYPTPVALHDYRYLGTNFRERERIGRKKKRWVAKLTAMPTLERRCLLNAIDEAWRSRAAGNSEFAGGIATPGESGRKRQK